MLTYFTCLFSYKMHFFQFSSANYFKLISYVWYFGIQWFSWCWFELSYKQVRSYIVNAHLFNSHSFTNPILSEHFAYFCLTKIQAYCTKIYILYIHRGWLRSNLTHVVLNPPTECMNLWYLFKTFYENIM